MTEIAQERDYYSIVFTFNIPPKFFFKNQIIEVLTLKEEKAEIIKSKKVDHIIFQEFNEEFANLDAEKFIKIKLIEELNLKILIIGDDHKFGKDNSGNFDKLKELSTKYNFELIKIDTTYVNDNRVSSSNVRNALKNGNIDFANSLLGYKYFVVGEIIAGKQIGRKIGFPTANLLVHPEKILPQNGVYVVTAQVENRTYEGICNIGYRPSINMSKKVTIEVHLIDFREFIYGQKIKVSFWWKIREEQKFNNHEELVNQIYKDKKFAINFFSK